MILTHEYIERHKSQAGGWTKKQLAALGVSWPPKSGWKSRIVGRRISDADAMAFEKASGEKNSESVHTFKTTGGKFVPLCDCTSPPWEDCPHSEALAQQAMNEILYPFSDPPVSQK